MNTKKALAAGWLHAEIEMCLQCEQKTILDSEVVKKRQRGFG